jgi:hypothetical protein
MLNGLLIFKSSQNELSEIKTYPLSLYRVVEILYRIMKLAAITLLTLLCQANAQGPTVAGYSFGKASETVPIASLPSTNTVSCLLFS